MKTRFICGVSMMAVLSLFSACSKKDDAKPLPIVGTWNLDSYYFQDIATNFDSWNGKYSGSNFGEQSNTLTINNDKTYTWRIGYTGPDFNDTGKWTLTDTKLSLTSTSGNDDQEFKVEETISATQMLISQVQKLKLLPNAVADTLTTEEWNNTTLTNQLYTNYGQIVDVTVVSLYEK